MNKLRGELGEAQAREQAARTEAEGLAQERGDLVARAEVRAWVGGGWLVGLIEAHPCVSVCASVHDRRPRSAWRRWARR